MKETGKVVWYPPIESYSGINKGTKTLQEEEQEKRRKLTGDTLQKRVNDMDMFKGGMK
jgi:hypothetical protein